MKTKFDFRRVTALLLCLLLWGAPQSAFAAKLEEVEETSLTLSYTVGEDSAPMGEVEFRIYRVAEITGALTFRLLPPFDGYSLTETADWLARASTLAGLVARDRVPPTGSARTDGEGRVCFQELEKGLYLILGDSKTVEGYLYTPTPFLLSLPYTDDGRNWTADVETYVKYGRRTLGGDGGTDPDTVQCHVLKVWEDAGREEDRPGSVQVDLLRGGSVHDTVTLSAENNWRYTWTDLDADAAWQVAERQTEGYSVSVSQSGVTFVITNTVKETTPPQGGGDPEEEEPPLEEDLTEWEIPLAEPEVPGPGEEPPPEEELGDESVPLTQLPQTGQLWWPVPVMAMGGAVLMSLGFARRRRWSQEDEE